MTMHTARCYWCLHTSTGCTGECRRAVSTPAWHGPHRVEKGCICPPGSEATCQRSDCGRKDQSFKPARPAAMQMVRRSEMARKEAKPAPAPAPAQSEWRAPKT